MKKDSTPTTPAPLTIQQEQALIAEIDALTVQQIELTKKKIELLKRLLGQ